MNHWLVKYFGKCSCIQRSSWKETPVEENRECIFFFLLLCPFWNILSSLAGMASVDGKKEEGRRKITGINFLIAHAILHWNNLTKIVVLHHSTLSLETVWFSKKLLGTCAYHLKRNLNVHERGGFHPQSCLKVSLNWWSQLCLLLGREGRRQWNCQRYVFDPLPSLPKLLLYTRFV